MKNNAELFLLNAGIPKMELFGGLSEKFFLAPSYKFS